MGRTFTGRGCDFSDRAALRGFIEMFVNMHPGMGILVNNAGSILRRPAAEHSDEYWDRIIEINQTAPFTLLRELGRRMIEMGGGKIIFTGSLLTFQGVVECERDRTRLHIDGQHRGLAARSDAQRASSGSHSHRPLGLGG